MTLMKTVLSLTLSRQDLFYIIVLWLMSDDFING